MGRIDGWLISSERGLELLVRSGRWEPVVRRVPCADVLWKDFHAVLLCCERRQFLALPRYVPDQELQPAVQGALLAFPSYTPVRSIEIRVQDGVVQLSGHVANELHRRESIRRAAGTPGVLRVEDHLVTDERLRSDVALAMQPHPELQPSRVRISGSLGAVLLEGGVDSPRDIALAVSVAAAVPGVTAVESRLVLKQPDGGGAGAPPPSGPGEVRISAR